MYDQQPWRRSVVLALMGSAAFAVAGCGGAAHTEAPTAQANVAAAQFRSADAPPPKPAPRGEPLTVEVGVATDGLRDVAALAGAPRDAVRPDAKPTADPRTLDALVGQINGKPIYADAFFGKLDARLRSERLRARDDATFQALLEAVIVSELQKLTYDELLTAEARSELTPEQRQGLFYFMNQIRDNLASEAGGSRETADARLREKDNRTFEEKVDDELRRALQVNVLRKHLLPRINVSWRDVLRQYEKEYVAAATESAVVFRMIIIDAADATVADAVTAALAAGKPFDEAARVPSNQFPTGDAGVVVSKYTGDLASARLTGDPVIDGAVRALSPGAHAGPVETADTRARPIRVWVKLEEIRQPTPVPLAEVQLRVYNQLVERRRIEEEERFRLRLMAKASATPLADLQQRLIAVGMQRYAGRAGAQP